MSQPPASASSVLSRSGSTGAAAGLIGTRSAVVEVPSCSTLIAATTWSLRTACDGEGAHSGALRVLHPRRATPGCSPSGELAGCTSHPYWNEQNHHPRTPPETQPRTRSLTSPHG